MPETATEILQSLTRVITCTLLYTTNNSTNQEANRIPLNSLTYDVSINGALAEVTLTQDYSNPETVPISLNYQFPISNKLVFSKFEAEYQGKKIKGKVKAKEEAKKEYEDNVKKGNTVAYADIYEKTKDIMNLKLGNFPPKENIKIRLTYTLRMDVLEFSKWSLRIPSTLTPRYIGKEIESLPDFEEAKKKYPDYYKFTAKKKYPWYINVKINWPDQIQEVMSPTHRDVLEVTSDKNTAELSFDKEKPQYPDKDFVLVVTDKTAFKSMAVISQTNFTLNNSDFPRFGALVQFIPEFYDWNLDDKGNMIETGAQFDKDNYDFLMSTTVAEFIFVLDRSGSMSDKRIENAKKALEAFLKSLPGGSFFNIISFGSSYSKLYPSSMKTTEENIQNAINTVKTFNADMGGTEIYTAVKAATDLKPLERTQRIIFLLTDGSIGNTEYFLKNVKNTFFYNEARMFTIGIGNGVSTYLVEEAAKMGNGKSIIITDNNDPTDRILGLLKESLSPSLTDFRVQFDSRYILGISPLPIKNSHVTINNPFTMFIVFNNDLNKTESKSTMLTLEFYDTADRKLKKRNFILDLNLAKMSDIPFQMFTKYLLDDEERNYQNSYIDPRIVNGKKPSKEFSTELAVAYQVVSPKYTAFICVIDESGENKANKTVEVPNLVSNDYSGNNGGDIRRKGVRTGGGGGATYSAMPMLAGAPAPPPSPTPAPVMADAVAMSKPTAPSTENAPKPVKETEELKPLSIPDAPTDEEKNGKGAESEGTTTTVVKNYRELIGFGVAFVMMLKFLILMR